MITLQEVTLRIGGEILLPETSWQICEGEHWAILGANGSGKSALAKAVKGDLPPVRGRLIRHSPEAAGTRIGYVAFELQEEILLREDRREEARFFSGNQGHALTAGELLARDGGGKTLPKGLVRLLGLGPLLAQGLQTLSNGEFRKILIARALLRSPRLLILDDPFAGLDTDNRKLLAATITDLMHHGTQLILVTQRVEEVLPGITHVALIRQGHVILTERRGAVLTPSRMESFLKEDRSPLGNPLAPPPMPDRRAATAVAAPRVEMRHVAVSYGDAIVFRDLNWTVRQGEHWAVVGPNGSGKTTLLRLITGDNLQVYANEVYLFGKKRGEGESIWDIRRRLGVVSPELQLQYRHPIPAREVILSGFFDSIGLYRKATGEQIAMADQWLECIGMKDRINRPFNRLSYGEKRLILIVRAMVKIPELLILDEPCQGLDTVNREMVLTLMQRIGSGGSTGLIYITHHPEELIPCISHILRLDKGGAAATHALLRSFSGRETSPGPAG